MDVSEEWQGERNQARHPASLERIRWEELGRLIWAKRQADGLTLEDAARDSGVSAATLSRWERQRLAVAGHSGSSMPKMQTLALVADWLRVPLDRIVERTPLTPAAAHGIVHHEGESTPDIVAAHLRADPNLDPQTAAALARAFQAIYEQFAALQPGRGAEDKPSSRGADAAGKAEEGDA